METIRKNPVLLSLLVIAFGAILFVWPDMTTAIAVRLLGTVLLLGGAVTVLSQYLHREERDSLTICGAAVALIFGLAILINPDFLIALFPIAAGVFIALHGAAELIASLKLKETGYAQWTIPCVLSVISLTLGIVMFANPFSTVRVFMMATGMTLIYNGIATIWITTRK